jgi:hypothetical protein
MGEQGPRWCAGAARQSKWERRLVKFLELSGVGRVMANGTDEDGAHAARMDGWIVVEGTAPRDECYLSVFLCIFFPTSLSCKGGSSETCIAEVGGFPL